MRVMKFGGTSVGNAERIRNVAAIVRQNLTAVPIVVVSAVVGVTNELIELANQKHTTARVQKFEAIRAQHEKIVEELGLDPALLDTIFDELESLCKSQKTPTKKSLDHFVSFGERLCAPMVAGALRGIGIAAEAFPAWDIGMIVDEHFGGAEPLETTSEHIKQKLEALDLVPVITGYIGKTEKGDIATLGRGGSDYSAAVIGAAVKADAIQIWKEVDGIMTTDPRLVPEARVVPELAFEEASELAYFGAKVLHPKTILPAMKAGVPVQVLNTFNPEGKGTTIVASFAERKEKSRTVEALTFKRGVIAVHIDSPEFFDSNGLMARIFELFDKYETSIDVITTSVASVSVTIDNDENLESLVVELKQLGEVTVERGKAIVCAVGGSVNAAGVAGRMFTVLGENNIRVEMISQAASGVSMTFVVSEDDAEKAIKVLHNEYIN